MKILGVIPARYASTRFPGKPLAYIAGKPMIQWVYEQCKKATLLDEVVVATDDERIQSCVASFGGKAVMTREDHLNGTSRCAEALSYFLDYESVINIQGDEPTIGPDDINSVAQLLKEGASIATLYAEITAEEISKTSVVKVLVHGSNASTFSRKASINVKKHVGIYGFDSTLLPKLISLKPTENELSESLEQLRWLDNGYTIAITASVGESHGVDIPEDVKAVATKIVQKKMKAIKAIITDVDGVLTDGKIIYDSAGQESKTFNVKDGQICSVLRRNGFKLGIITGRKSKMVKRRGKELGFDSIKQNCKDKALAINTFAEKYELALEEIAYIGDDINDLPAYALVGLSVAPADAPAYIRQRATLVLERRGGQGVFRELADCILIAQNLPIL